MEVALVAMFVWLTILTMWGALFMNRITRAILKTLDVVESMLHEDEWDEIVFEPPKKKRGRPRKQ